jgi:hypothetical protein
MTELNPWELVSQGEGEAGLRLLLRNYPTTGDLAMVQIDEPSLAYLWLGEYARGWGFLQDAIGRRSTTVDALFALAGVAKWCMDEPIEAVKVWKKGIKTGYGDLAGGIGVPTLLLGVSLLRPELNDHPAARQAFSEARKVLKIRVEKPRAKACWPGPLGRYVLGQIDASLLREMCDSIACHKPGMPLHESEVADYLWEADFYEGVMGLSQGNKERFAELINKMVATVEKNVYDPEIFPSRLRSEEFFLARHELYRLRGVPDTGPGATGPIPHPNGAE